jgi:alanine-synthesizing transaminase
VSGDRPLSGLAVRKKVELRRVGALPPYVFAAINELKLELRRAGEDVVDLGFGNPDLPSPEIAVEKLHEAVLNPRNHRYSASRGLPNLRRAICDLYERRFGVSLDPERQALTTIGAKEGLAHLMWVLVQPGDAALVPSPSYPIHLVGPAFAGAVVEQVPMGPDEDLFANVVEALERSRPKPRVLVLSIPHNPTTAVVDPDFDLAGIDVEHDLSLASIGILNRHCRCIFLVDCPAGQVADEDRLASHGFSSRRLS